MARGSGTNMRLVLIIVGVSVMLAGLVLALTPISTVRTQTATPTTPVEYNVTSAFTATGGYPLSFTWASPENVTIVAATCDSVNPATTGLFSVCGGFALVTTQIGINGGFSVAPKLGAIVLIWVLPANPNGSAPSVTVKIVGAQPVLGALTLLAGGAVTVVGIVLRKKKRPGALADEEGTPGSGSEPPAWAQIPPSGPPPEW